MLEFLRQTSAWFTGGSTQYMTLWHCMQHDTLWVAITVVMDLLVATGYVLPPCTPRI